MIAERESPEAAICGQLLIVQNTLSLLLPHSPRKSPTPRIILEFLCICGKSEEPQRVQIPIPAHYRATVEPPIPRSRPTLLDFHSHP